jgi:hypothetical protein
MHRYPKKSKSEVIRQADELQKSVKGLSPNHIIHMLPFAASNTATPYPTPSESLDQSGRKPEKSPK